MVDKQREKEFLFELERLYHNYNLVVSCTDHADLILLEVDYGNIDQTTKFIERHIDELRVKTVKDEPLTRFSWPVLEFKRERKKDDCFGELHNLKPLSEYGFFKKEEKDD